MAEMSRCLTHLEHWNINLGIVQRTKIRKVLKEVLKLDYIPAEEEFQIRAKANALLKKWNQLGRDASVSTRGDERRATLVGITNGTMKTLGDTTQQ